MKFIVDESTGRSVADFLSEEGYETVYVGDEMLGAPDPEIMERAEEEGRVIVTNDKDFGELAVREGKDAEGIILLRLKIETPEKKKESMKQLLQKHEDRIQDNLLVVREDNIKVRKL